MFQSDPSPVARGAAAAQPAVAERARHVLALLLPEDDPLLASLGSAAGGGAGGGSAAGGGAVAAGGAAAAAAAAPNLLDLLGDDLSPAVATEPTAAAPGRGLDAFFGAELSGATVPAVTSTQPAATAAPSATAAAAPVDPFAIAASPGDAQTGFGDFMSAGTGAALGPAPHTSPPGRPPLADFFSDMSLGGSGASVPPVAAAGTSGVPAFGAGMSGVPAFGTAAGTGCFGGAGGSSGIGMGMGGAKGGAPMKPGVATAKPAAKDPFADLI
eukprot:288231-Chlamydomonas_euryale.AAC.1